MRAKFILISVALCASTAALAAEEAGARPQLAELIAQGYETEASGELVIRRKLITPRDQGIFLHGRAPSCIGAPIATMRDRVDSCQVIDVRVYWARFHRMAKGEVAFVCILSDPDECYPVH